MATATVQQGRLNSVVVESVDSVQWAFQLPDTHSSTIDAVRRHLQWITHVRQQFFELKNDIELAAGVIREHAESMEWTDAQREYRAIRDRLDRFICTLELTTPIPNQVIAPGLTESERTLEKAHVILYVERARSELELGRYLVEHEDSVRPKKALQRALRFYECAIGQQDAVERGDAFQFGTQRTLKRAIEELGWELEMVAAEPRRQAEEAKQEAQDTDTASTAIECWETVLRRYEQALLLDLGDHTRQFTGNPTEIRSERDIAVDMLIELRTEAAQTEAEKTRMHQQAGERLRAISTGETALSHLERVRELATQYDRPALSDLEDRLSRLNETVTALRTNRPDASEAANSHQLPQSTEHSPNPAPDPEQVDEHSTLWRSDSSTDTGSAETAHPSPSATEPIDIPSLNDIKRLDTHSDITFTLADPSTESDQSDLELRDDVLRPEEPRDPPEKVTTAFEDRTELDEYQNTANTGNN